MQVEPSDLALWGSIAAGVPTAALSLLSFFAKRTLESIEGAVRELGTEVKGIGVQVTALDKGNALLELRVAALERDFHDLKRTVAEGGR